MNDVQVCKLLGDDLLVLQLAGRLDGLMAGWLPGWLDGGLAC